MAEHSIDRLEKDSLYIIIVPATNVPTDSIPNRALAQSEHELRAPLLVPDAGCRDADSLASNRRDETNGSMYPSDQLDLEMGGIVT
jgi:hypothetical protein